MACQGAEFDKERASKVIKEVLDVLKNNDVDLKRRAPPLFDPFGKTQQKLKEDLEKLLNEICWIQDCRDF